MEGLCWVLEYYYQGVPAWDWFYPYHYAPFAQDFQDVGKMDIQFEVAQPFKPFAQLLGVFPAASRKHLPEPLQGLMINPDSPILDFYPEEFDIDMNGKKMAWQGVALLPFIDQTRLLAALKSKEDQLDDGEKKRNAWGDNVMFVSETGKLFDPLSVLYGLKPITQVRFFLLISRHADRDSLCRWNRSNRTACPALSSPTRHVCPRPASNRPCLAFASAPTCRPTPLCRCDTTFLGRRTSTARSCSADTGQSRPS